MEMESGARDEPGLRSLFRGRRPRHKSFSFWRGCGHRRVTGTGHACESAIGLDFGLFLGQCGDCLLNRPIACDVFDPSAT
jgi:hypothetical protein